MTEDDDEFDDSTLIAEWDRLRGARCFGCNRDLCGHAVLGSVALGFRDFPRCFACLAAGLQITGDEFARRLTEYVQRRDCYRRAWEAANHRENLVCSAPPPCLVPGTLKPRDEFPIKLPESTPEPIDEWNAGELACGELVLELRRRLSRMPRGAILRVIARDAAAPEDLPAWCRLTGHRLIFADPPAYHIQRR